MRKIRRVFAMITACFSLVFPFCFSVTAHAASEYLRIIDGETPIYEDSEMKNFLFYMPYTYYVKVLSTVGNVAHVECSGASLPAIDGYTPSERLYADGLSVPFAYADVTVTTCKSAALYSDITLANTLRYIFAERSLDYYGSVSTDTGYAYFVAYAGEVGYVKEDCLYPFTVPNHPNPLTFIETETPEQTVEPKSEGGITLTLRIIIISCLVAAGLIAALTFKKPKSNDAGYYDENDFG